MKQGKSNASFWPCPMVYPQEHFELPPHNSHDDSNCITIGVCCLCLFPFPQHNIVVSNCRHLYHPFYASLLFVNSSKCMAKGCGEIPHPDWYNSFGWREPPTEMKDQASMLGVVEERGPILHARKDQGKAMLPSTG